MQGTPSQHRDGGNIRSRVQRQLSRGGRVLAQGCPGENCRRACITIPSEQITILQYSTILQQYYDYIRRENKYLHIQDFIRI